MVGRAISALLVGWLGVLALGALGLQPLGRLPLVSLVPDRSAPASLPARMEAAVHAHRAVAIGAPSAVPVAPALRGRTAPLRVLGVGGLAIGAPGRVLTGTGPLATRRPAVRRHPGGASSPSPQRSAPTTGGSAGTAPAQTAPPSSSSGTGTTPAPAPSAPGRSGTAPGHATPVVPPRGKPANPGSARVVHPVTVASG